MMVEFLLNDIKDKSKLYRREQVEGESPFSYEPETFESIVYVGKDYCTTAMEAVVRNLPGVKVYEYKGALERVANEVFQIMTDAFLL